MNLRHDAVAGAAEWIVEIEKEALRIPGMTATVGKIEAKPGAANVIAGEVSLTLDIRHRLDAVRAAAERNMIHSAEEIARRRGLRVRQNRQMTQSAVMMDSTLVQIAEKAVRSAGCEPHRMLSGAGHDAMILAERVPSAMIFLRTPGGISHNPGETVSVEDVAKALESGVHLLDLLTSSPISQRSAQRA
jgi:allantoate deiminase